MPYSTIGRFLRTPEARPIEYRSLTSVKRTMEAEPFSPKIGCNIEFFRTGKAETLQTKSKSAEAKSSR